MRRFVRTTTALLFRGAPHVPIAPRLQCACFSTESGDVRCCATARLATTTDPPSKPAAEWNVTEVGTWLATHGVSSDAITTCAQEGIGGLDLVCGFSDEYLKALGVVVGDRRAILEALTKLDRNRPSLRAAALIAPIRAVSERAFEADYASLVSACGPVRIIDVCLASHKFKHATFHQICRLKKLLAFPLGDKTAVFGKDAHEYLLKNEDCIRRRAVTSLKSTFPNPEAIVRAFPALHYLGLKCDKKAPTALTAAHTRYLVECGEGVLRCLTTEVQPTLQDLQPCFKHSLTCDLRFVTGLRRAYTDSVTGWLERLEASLEQAQESVNEHFPFHAIISLLSMGKSLLLQDLARRLDSKGKRVATITYTGGTMISSCDKRSVEGAVTGCFVRLLLASVFPAGLDTTLHYSLWRALTAGSLDASDFRRTLDVLGVPLPDVVLVDEFSKLLDRFSSSDQEAIIKGILPLASTTKFVFSGFSTAMAPPFFAASGRSIETHFIDLPPVSAECLEDFRVRLAPQRALMMKVSPLLYLSCQCCPALLGHFFQALLVFGASCLPPLRVILRGFPSERPQLVEWLRDLTAKELCGVPRCPDAFLNAQRGHVALVVDEHTTVAHPFALVTVFESVSWAEPGHKKRGTTKTTVHVDTNLQQQKAVLVDLIRELSALHTTLFEAQGQPSGDDGNQVLRATNRGCLGACVFAARAVRMLAMKTSVPVELDAGCVLQLAPRLAPGNPDARDDTGSDAAALCGRLAALTDGGVRAFVWRLRVDDSDAAAVLEGELGDCGWALTLTEATVGNAPPDALKDRGCVWEQHVAVVVAAISPAVASLRVVLLCPSSRGAGANLSTETPLVRVATDVKAVREHVSTPIAALLPTIGISHS